jgi:hypothetical protein
VVFGLVFLTSGIADSHNGLVDGYGCHRDPKKGNYHCHQGPYAGKSFPSRDEFLRQLRNPKSNLPQPKYTASRSNRGLSTWKIETGPRGR